MSKGNNFSSEDEFALAPRCYWHMFYGKPKVPLDDTSARHPEVSHHGCALPRQHPIRGNGRRNAGEYYYALPPSSQNKEAGRNPQYGKCEEIGDSESAFPRNAATWETPNLNPHSDTRTTKAAAVELVKGSVVVIPNSGFSVLVIWPGLSEHL
eukprot:IDg3211t1